MAKKKKKAAKPCACQPVNDMNMCKLIKEGLTDEIQRRSDTPTAHCKRCQARANEARDLCQPRQLR